MLFLFFILKNKLHKLLLMMYSDFLHYKIHLAYNITTALMHFQLSIYHGVEIEYCIPLIHSLFFVYFVFISKLMTVK